MRPVLNSEVGRNEKETLLLWVFVPGYRCMCTQCMKVTAETKRMSDSRNWRYRWLAELLRVCWEPSLNSLQEQQAFLAVEPCLQPLHLNIYLKKWVAPSLQGCLSFLKQDFTMQLQHTSNLLFKIPPIFASKVFWLKAYYHHSPAGLFGSMTE